MPAFPELTPGIITQLPFVAERRFTVARVDQESGPRYAYYYAAEPVAAWELTFVALTEAELDALRAFVDGQGGAWDEFTFTDPDTSVTHNKCRFADQELKVVYSGPNEYQITLRIEEFR